MKRTAVHSLAGHLLNPARKAALVLGRKLGREGGFHGLRAAEENESRRRGEWPTFGHWTDEGVGPRTRGSAPPSPDRDPSRDLEGADGRVSEWHGGWRARSLYFLLAFLTAFTASCVPSSRTAAAKPAVAVPPPLQPTMERQIRNAIDAGDGDYQIRTLREKMAAKPDDVQVRLELAQAYRDRGYPDIALEHCRLATARFPESGAAQLALARALRDMRLQAEAAQGLEEFLGAHPQRAPEYFSWLGILRDELGQWALAEPSHRAALDLAPEAEYLHNNLGYNLLMQKKNAEAIAEFREALRLNPKSVVANNNLGLALARQNAAEQAIQSWQAAGDSATAHNNLAAVFIQEGKFAEARRELDTALGYNKQLPAALKNLELVSRLDGNSATVTMKTPATRWDRIKIELGKIFGPEESQPASGVNTASVPSTGEGR